MPQPSGNPRKHIVELEAFSDAFGPKVKQPAEVAPISRGEVLAVIYLSQQPAEGGVVGGTPGSALI